MVMVILAAKKNQILAYFYHFFADKGVAVHDSLKKWEIKVLKDLSVIRWL